MTQIEILKELRYIIKNVNSMTYNSDTEKLDEYEFRIKCLIKVITKNERKNK